jgi:hypothetical protein
MSQKRSITHKLLPALILLASAVLAIVSLSTETYAQENVPKVSLEIEVYDINRFEQATEVNITIRCRIFALDNVSESESLHVALGDEVNRVKIQCNRTSSGEYVGSTGLINWVPGGPLARLAYFPFDEYMLIFQVKEISPESFNASSFSSDEISSSAHFNGSRRSSLSEAYVTNSTYDLKTFFDEDLKSVAVVLEKRLGPFSLDFFFWPFVAPTIACYCFLAASLLLSGKEQLSNRLRIFVAIFIFSPTF